MCDSCEALIINGVLCHERGCPDAWKDEIRECPWCGTHFVPESQYERYCSYSCFRAYSGFSDSEE
jgi:hypothetical protein